MRERQWLEKLSWRHPLPVAMILASVLLAACSRTEAGAEGAGKDAGAQVGSRPIELAALAAEPHRFHQRSVHVVGVVGLEVVTELGNVVREPESGLALWLIPDREPRLRFAKPERCSVRGVFDAAWDTPGTYAGALHVGSIGDCVPLKNEK